MKLNAKRELKFFGKFTTYIFMVGAIISLIKGDNLFAISSLFMILIGCAMHEYSEVL